MHVCGEDVAHNSGEEVRQVGAEGVYMLVKRVCGMHLSWKRV